jgi:hypothetical protein
MIIIVAVITFPLVMFLYFKGKGAILSQTDKLSVAIVWYSVVGVCYWWKKGKSLVQGRAWQNKDLHD